MIDARELRVGNWTQFNNEFTWLDGYSLYLASRGDIELDPIPLTPEILENVGFVWVNILHDGTAVYKGKPYLYFKDGIGTISAAAIRIKYPHQLQNLYWCLMGKELEIKL